MNRIGLSLVLVGALSLFTPGCAKKSIDDQALTTAVQSKLYADATTRQAGVTVAVKDGIVTLSGDVPNDAVAQEAAKVANGTEGVRGVNNQMKMANAAASAASIPPATNPAPAASAPPPSQPAASTPARQTPAPASAKTAAAPAKPAEPESVTIPAGTRLAVRTADVIDSGKATEGQTYRASLDSPLISRGRVVVPAGSDVTLVVTGVKGAGRIKGSSELSLRATTLQYRGQTYNLASSVYADQGKARGKNTAVKTGIGAAAGALIGGLAGGGKGAAIGSAAGGGAGFGWNALTHGQQVKIPAETVLNFRLEAPLTVPVSSGAE